MVFKIVGFKNGTCLVDRGHRSPVSFTSLQISSGMWLDDTCLAGFFFPT